MKRSVSKNKNDSLLHSSTNLPELETTNLINKRQELHEMDDEVLKKVEKLTYADLNEQIFEKNQITKPL